MSDPKEAAEQARERAQRARERAAAALARARATRERFPRLAADGEAARTARDDARQPEDRT